MPLTSDQIPVLDKITRGLFHVEKRMIIFVLENVTAQHNGVDNSLLAATELMFERIVCEMVSSPQIIPQIQEAVINNSRFIAPTPAFVQSEQCNYTDRRAKVEKRYRKYFKVGMKLNPVAAPSPSEIGLKPATEISSSIRMSLKAY